jgi:predicted nucleic acid-binding protein
MTERFVVDNSVVMAWCFEDENRAYADKILDRLTAATAVVPAIWPLEVVNVLLAAERRQRLRQADSLRFVAMLLQLPISVDYDRPQNAMSGLLALGRETALSSYDAAYLDLAIRRGCPLATLDRRLIDAARATGVAVLKG